jgi:hypothetical protein
VRPCGHLKSNCSTERMERPNGGSITYHVKMEPSFWKGFAQIMLAMHFEVPSGWVWPPWIVERCTMNCLKKAAWRQHWALITVTFHIGMFIFPWISISGSSWGWIYSLYMPFYIHEDDPNEMCISTPWSNPPILREKVRLDR